MVLIFLPSGYREALARGVRGTILRPVLALQRGAVERNALLSDPARLRAERDSLAAFLVGQSGVVAENQRLRDLLGLRQRVPVSFAPAEVVRLPGRGSEGYFELTAGANQGVTRGASIVAAQGLIGQVREVDENNAFGIDWMNSEFRASAMTVDGEIYGILEPRRVEGEPLLVLTGTPRHVELRTGSLIVTSGHGGVFPRGIPIGTVVGQESVEASWQRNYLVRPLVGPSEMTYVLVLGDPEPSRQGQDLASVWGIRPPSTDPRPMAGEEVERGASPAATVRSATPPSASPTATTRLPPSGHEPSTDASEAVSPPVVRQPEAEPTPTVAQPPRQGPSLLGEPVDQPQDR